MAEGVQASHEPFAGRDAGLEILTVSPGQRLNAHALAK